MTPARLLATLLADPLAGERLTADEWQSVLTVARAERLDGTLAVRLSGHALPTAVRDVMEDARADLAHNQRAARWEVERVGEALASLDAPSVLLKGCAFLLGDESAAEGRRIGDVDLLVPRDSLPLTERLLLDAGWEWAKADPYDDAYYRRWMHELPPLIHATRNSLVDVHHTLLPLTAGPTPDPDALIGRSRPVVGTTLRVPGPTDLMIHASAHLIDDGELDGGLRNLWDIHCLATAHGSDDFWAELESHAIGHELSAAVGRALRLCRTLFGTSAPFRVAGHARATDRLFTRRLLARDGWGRGLRPATRLGFAVRGHLLRMPPRLLLPHLWRKWRRSAG